MPAILLNPKVLLGLGFALVLAFAGIQTARLHHAKADLSAARASLAASRAALSQSEKSRAAEFTSAKTAVSDALAACEARVAEAHRSAVAISHLVGRPVSVDPKTNCPARALLGAGELRDALGVSPAAPPSP